MKDVMIDFETFGNGQNQQATICQVGACYFDKVTGEIGPTFAANIDARSCQKIGSTLDADTVYWWLQQSEAARQSLMDNQRDIKDVFNNLNHFLSGAERIWSHATFDFVLLNNTMKTLEIKPAFSYKAGLDLRTLTYLAKVSTSDFVRDGTHHNGLADAIFQVKYAVAAMTKIQGDRALISRLKNIIG